jgi:hypothetical protein
LSEGDERSAEFTPNPVADSVTPERRTKLRLTGPFPARARVVDRAGKSHKINCAVRNISAGGLFLQLEQQVEPGVVLFIVTQFSGAWRREARVARVAVRGPVLRVESGPDGQYGVAVAITRHRFL